MSKTSPKYMPTFELNKSVVHKAERYNLDFALSMIKLRGFGGVTEHWDHNLGTLSFFPFLHMVYACLVVCMMHWDFVRI